MGDRAGLIGLLGFFFSDFVERGTMVLRKKGRDERERVCEGCGA